MRLSFLLTTKRPPSYCKDVLESIYRHHGDGDYEILIFSPDKFEGPKIRWFKEEESSQGCVKGFNYLYKQSQGDYVCVAVDDYNFESPVWAAIDLLESPIYQNRRFKITSLYCGGALCPINPGNFTLIGFPLFKRSTVEEHLGGYLFHPRFHHHYSDCWLSWWMGMHGENPRHCYNAQIRLVHNIHYNEQDEYDGKVFKELQERFLTGVSHSYV